jgi:hypothetical protein
MATPEGFCDSGDVCDPVAAFRPGSDARWTLFFRALPLRGEDGVFTAPFGGGERRSSYAFSDSSRP